MSSAKGGTVYHQKYSKAMWWNVDGHSCGCVLGLKEN